MRQVESVPADRQGGDRHVDHPVSAPNSHAGGDLKPVADSVRNETSDWIGWNRYVGYPESR